MIPTPLPSRTNCRIDAINLCGTAMRLETLFKKGPCPHYHVSKAIPPCELGISVYIVLDSNCHSGWQGCDKGEGDWIWIIACASHYISYALPVEYTVKSLEPRLLKVLPEPNDPSSATAEYTPEVPLWIYPFYAKARRPNCEPTHVRISRYPSHEFRRAPLEISTEIGICGSIDKQKHKQLAKMGIAIVPKEEKLRRTEMSEWERKLNRLTHLDKLLDDLYEKRAKFETELAISEPGAGRISLEQRMVKEVLPEIHKYEIEQALLIHDLTKPDDVNDDQAKALLSDTVGVLTLLRSSQTNITPSDVIQKLDMIERTLNATGVKAAVKLHACLPIFPDVAYLTFELSVEKKLTDIWKRIRFLFSKAIGRAPR